MQAQRPLLLLLLAGCTSFAESRIDDRVPESPAAQRHESVHAAPPPAAPDAALLAQFPRGSTVSLAQLVGFALKTNPLTRASWADARAAAAALGSKNASYMPELDLVGGWETKNQQFTPSSKLAYKDWNAGLQLNWLLLDFGGRSGDSDEARALLAAANLNHDQTVQDLILRVEQTYAQYQGARALLKAQQSNVEEARLAFEVAEERRKQGLATVADVLQAKTAYSQAQLNLQTVDGQVQTLRGAVATAVGVPATVPIDAEELPEVNVDGQQGKIDDLIAQALNERPDVLRARVEVEAAKSHVSSVRSRGLPSLGLTAGASVIDFIQSGYPSGTSWNVGLVVRFPLFTGFRDSFDVTQAQEQANAAEARAESFEQLATYTVWASYQGVLTAARRVTAARDLLQSAQQSAEVAAGRYKEGVGSILDLLTARSSLALARAQEVQARADWQLAVASLAHDTGALGTAAHGETK